MHSSYFSSISIDYHTFTLFIITNDIFGLRLCIRAIFDVFQSTVTRLHCLSSYMTYLILQLCIPAIFDAFQSTVTRLHCLSSQITYLIYDYAFESFSIHFYYSSSHMVHSTYESYSNDHY
jgi:hypothetical protein